jgi:hypothetical protein
VSGGVPGRDGCCMYGVSAGFKGVLKCPAAAGGQLINTVDGGRPTGSGTQGVGAWFYLLGDS